MALSLRQVRYFIAVAENGSVTGAAQQLSVSQSTVTEAIKGLEDELGVQLIERQARGVALSYKGQQFLRHAHRILAEVSDAQSALRDQEAPLGGSLHIGVTTLVAGYCLSDLLARFRRVFPAVQVSAVEDTRDYLEHLLLNGEIDVAVIIVSNLRDNVALETETLQTSSYHLWLPSGHRLLRSGPVSLTEMAEEALIVLSVDEVEEVTGRYWRQAGVRPKVAFRTRSVEAVRSLVATGAGIAVLPDLAYRPWSLEGDRIEARPIKETLPELTVGVAWRKGLPLAPVAETFIDLAVTQRRR
ncbi:MAG: LysR substrate-binding domain-containing protein [Kiloniellaceae bacterium]